MKRISMLSLTFGIVLGFAAASFATQPSEAELMKQAKITKAQYDPADQIWLLSYDQNRAVRKHFIVAVDDRSGLR